MYLRKIGLHFDALHISQALQAKVVARPTREFIFVPALQVILCGGAESNSPTAYPDM